MYAFVYVDGRKRRGERRRERGREKEMKRFSYAEPGFINAVSVKKG